MILLRRWKNGDYMSTTWRYKKFDLTRFWGKHGIMYQITQDTGYVALSKRDFHTILNRIRREKI